jgi:pyruvate kinase
MNLYWGVQPVHCRQAHSAEQMVSMAEQDLLRRALLKPGEVLGVVAGTRQLSGSTNLMRLHVVTDEEAELVVHPAKHPKTSRPKKSRRK